MHSLNVAYSGKLIFCRLEKKSLLRMVDADRILPVRFATIACTSSGSASPSTASTRSRGFRVLILIEDSSFSNVLMTGRHYQRSTTLPKARSVPGRSSTKDSKVSKLCIVSGSMDCR